MEGGISNYFDVKLQHLKPNSIKNTLKLSYRSIKHKQGVTKCMNIYFLNKDIYDWEFAKPILVVFNC